MARAKICDRCGAVYGTNYQDANFGPNKNGIVKGVCLMFENLPDDKKNVYMDLCDDCAKQLITFLQNEVVDI